MPVLKFCAKYLKKISYPNEGRGLGISPAATTLGSLNIRSHADDKTIKGEGNKATTLGRSPFQLTNKGI